MAEFLLGAAAFIVGMVALGLWRILRGPSDTDRMMAAQLLGTGGVAVLLLVAIATGMRGVVDVALVLALVSALASAAFVVTAPSREGGADGQADPR